MKYADNGLVSSNMFIDMTPPFRTGRLSGSGVTIMIFLEVFDFLDLEKIRVFSPLNPKQGHLLGPCGAILPPVFKYV